MCLAVSIAGVSFLPSFQRGEGSKLSSLDSLLSSLQASFPYAASSFGNVGPCLPRLLRAVIVNSSTQVAIDELTVL